MKLLLLVVTVTLLKANLFGQEAKDITLRAEDENGVPIENARAVISFVGARKDDEHIGPTDRRGLFSAQGKVLAGIYMAASKDGYYPARFDTSRFDRLPVGRIAEKTLVLPRVVKPVALFVKRSGIWGAGLAIPVQDKWIGYDFVVGDWVQPYGKGDVPDIQFRFRNSFRGYDEYIKNLDEEMTFSRSAYAARNEEWTEEKFKLSVGRWDGELEISFPSLKEGLCEEKDRFLTYSTMKMPHKAPIEGYQPAWRYTANTYSPTSARDNVGFYLRTRVKLDDKANIISANYAKIVGDFHFSPANGAMQFLYYFNPVPNDRNLEFDPTKNLFPANFPGANVNDP